MCRYKRLIDLPEDPLRQLKLAVEALFRSWQTPRAIVYRGMHNIDGSAGTAATVQVMAFRHFGHKSDSGAACIRNPATAERQVFGDYMPNAAGEHVVAGIRTPLPLLALVRGMPATHSGGHHYLPLQAP